MNMKKRWFLCGFFMIGVMGFFPCACAVERTEYRYRSQSESDATGRPVDETFIKPDGTKVVYSSKRLEKAKDTPSSTTLDAPVVDPEQPVIDLRETKANGDVILRATFPEQVVAHVAECVRNEEYDLIWNQLLSVDAKKELQGRGGIQYLNTFFATNRKEVMATLTCMQINLKNGHVMLRKNGETHLTAEFDSTLRGNYRFTTIEFESTPTGMKLVSIR